MQIITLLRALGDTTEDTGNGVNVMKDNLKLYDDQLDGVCNLPALRSRPRAPVDLTWVGTYSHSATVFVLYR